MHSHIGAGVVLYWVYRCVRARLFSLSLDSCFALVPSVEISSYFDSTQSIIVDVRDLADFAPQTRVHLDVHLCPLALSDTSSSSVSKHSAFPLLF